MRYISNIIAVIRMINLIDVIRIFNIIMFPLALHEGLPCCSYFELKFADTDSFIGIQYAKNWERDSDVKTKLSRLTNCFHKRDASTKYMSYIQP